MSEHLAATVSQNTIIHFHAANHVPALIVAAGDRAGIPRPCRPTWLAALQPRLQAVELSLRQILHDL